MMTWAKILFGSDDFNGAHIMQISKIKEAEQ